MSKDKNNSLYEILAEKQVKREEIFDGVIARLVRDTVKLPNGNIGTREVLLHNGAVCVVALTDDNKIIMERQFRYPFDEVIWEIPAGKLEKGETSPLEAVKRELKEETGYSAKKYEFIGEYYPSPAMMSEKIFMYLATNLTKGERNLDEDEFLEFEEVPLNTVVKMIMDNEIPDGKTQAAVLRVYHSLQNGS